MSRPRSYVTAAVFLLLYSVFEATVTIPGLARGASPAAQTINGQQGPPYFLIVISFVLAVLCVIAAYGVWRMQKWGVVMGVVMAALIVLDGLPAVIFAPLPLRLIGGLVIVGAAAVVVLLLRSAPQPRAL